MAVLDCPECMICLVGFSSVQAGRKFSNTRLISSSERLTSSLPVSVPGVCPSPPPFVGDREKPGAERIAILGLGPGDYRGACLLRQVETMF